MDSNHDTQIQNLQCYRYTTRHQRRVKISGEPFLFQPRELLLLGLLLEVGEDGFGRLAMGEGGGVDADGSGPGVERFPLGVEFFQGAARVGGLQERAIAVFDPLVKMLGAGIEPDHGADLREEFAVLSRNDDPAASGHDQADASDEALQDFGFEGAEMFFAVLFENDGDGLSRFAGHKGVGIDEGEAGEG